MSTRSSPRLKLAAAAAATAINAKSKMGKKKKTPAKAKKEKPAKKQKPTKPAEPVKPAKTSNSLTMSQLFGLAEDLGLIPADQDVILDLGGITKLMGQIDEAVTPDDPRVQAYLAPDDEEEEKKAPAAEPAEQEVGNVERLFRARWPEYIDYMAALTDTDVRNATMLHVLLNGGHIKPASHRMTSSGRLVAR